MANATMARTESMAGHIRSVGENTKDMKGLLKNALHQLDAKLDKQFKALNHQQLVIYHMLNQIEGVDPVAATNEANAALEQYKQGEMPETAPSFKFTKSASDSQDSMSDAFGGLGVAEPNVATVNMNDDGAVAAAFKAITPPWKE